MSGYARPDENTLGAIVGKRGRSKPMSSPAAKALRQASAGGASLGTGFLGIGASLVAILAAVAYFTVFLVQFNSQVNPLPASFAWLVYSLALIIVGVVIALSGERMPHWLFAFYLTALVCVIALDFVAIWSLRNIGENATASVAASSGLLVAVALRRTSEILVAAALIGAAFITAMVLTTPLTPDTLPAQLVTITTVLLPPIFAVWLVIHFRRIVQVELDRVLVQSTVSAPRFAVGMLASEELARLDLAAEELFDSVASGRTKLPLDPKTASIAASLATELRLHLIEGRRETWLYHAITESEQLGKSVTLSDSGSLAGLLDSQQRDGLLSGVWLLVNDNQKDRPTVHLTLGPVTAVESVDNNSIVSVPIVITTTGISRNRVDPATWGSIAKVGTFSNTSEKSSLRVEIDCLVSNPADQYHAEQTVHR